MRGALGVKRIVLGETSSTVPVTSPAGPFNAIREPISVAAPSGSLKIEAKGNADRMTQEAEAYKAEVIALATGDAARFMSVYKEYTQAKSVTRKRIYLETMEGILSGMNKIILDDKAGSGVVPYLPLPEIQARRSGGDGQ